MATLKGTECEYCEATLTADNTQDWQAENGACDSCCDYFADSYLMREQAKEEANEALRTDN